MSQSEFITTEDPTSAAFQEHIWRYDFASKYAEDKVVLDVACGAGYGSLYLAKIGRAREVLGADYDKRAIEYAKKYSSDNVEFVLLDATDLPFNNAFDVIVSFETIEHIREYAKFVSECRRCLHPGGYLIVSTPNRLLSPPIKPRIWHHDHEFSPTEFFDLFEEFSEIEFFCQRPVNPVTHLIKVQTFALASHLAPKRPFSQILQLYREREKSNLKKEKQVVTAAELCTGALIKEDFNITPFRGFHLKMPRYILSVAKK